jgi:hypothetical protein
MKSCFVIPTVLALGSAIVWVDTSALAAEKPGPQQDASDMTTFTDKVGEICGLIAVKAKEIKVFDYCVVEMLRPYVQGPSCIAFVAGARDPGYHCDAEGMMYYEAPTEPLGTAPMTKEEKGDAFSKLLSKHTNKAIATCLLKNENNADVASCLAREKKRFGEIFRICTDTKFNVDTDELLLRAVDQCIENKSKL